MGGGERANATGNGRGRLGDGCGEGVEWEQGYKLYLHGVLSRLNQRPPQKQLAVYVPNSHFEKLEFIACLAFDAPTVYAILVHPGRKGKPINMILFSQALNLNT